MNDTEKNCSLLWLWLFALKSGIAFAVDSDHRTMVTIWSGTSTAVLLRSSTMHSLVNMKMLKWQPLYTRILSIFNLFHSTVWIDSFANAIRYVSTRHKTKIKLENVTSMFYSKIKWPEMGFKLISIVNSFLFPIRFRGTVKLHIFGPFLLNFCMIELKPVEIYWRCARNIQKKTLLFIRINQSLKWIQFIETFQLTARTRLVYYLKYEFYNGTNMYSRVQVKNEFFLSKTFIRMSSIEYMI